MTPCASQVNVCAAYTEKTDRPKWGELTGRRRERCEASVLYEGGTKDLGEHMNIPCWTVKQAL